MRVDNRRGFTLIELMLVVSIIGVIAAVAIPNFIMYQARSRRSEAYTNVSALARAQKAYQSERNAYHETLLSQPDPGMYGGLGARTMPWDADAEMAFSEVGWAPEGMVHYSYVTNTSLSGATGPNCGGCDLCFTAAAFGDVDGNNSIQTVLYVHPEVVSGTLAWCNTLQNMGVPPALDPDSGEEIFDAVAVRSNSDF